MKFTFSVGAVAAILAQQAYGFVPFSQPSFRAQHVLHTSTAVEAVTSETPSDEIDSVEFPPPLSQVDRLKRAATFWSTAIPIVANYYGLIGSIKLQELLGDVQTEEEIEVSAMERYGKPSAI
jgi:hypothetical protein